ncbi:uncharacterized protein SPSC_00779 [Sporisorium scitamineum]|uniref:GH26 domain-containing protein n=1 Tax=Sporisorium scitamineum TaxID=49012 RepID=A0A0F7S4F1_9BASI|nr:uncharacterized protein SPSC_00779 [Sporisorium scitamineum]CDW97797.1 hypothetical protein [Sporisorium scitamineum]
MTALTVNGISIGFYPDEGDAGGHKSYLSDLNSALSRSWSSFSSSTAQPPVITTVGWYAQTYPSEQFTGFQLMPLVDDIKREYSRCPTHYIYEASVMPFQSWAGFTPQNNTKAIEVAQVMQAMLEQSRVGQEFAIGEIRLRFGHEVNYYIKSGLYPPPTTSDQGYDYRTAFDTVALACRSLAHRYSSRIKMFWCPNIASTSTGALAEYQTFLPLLQYIDYVGIDYYCPAPGSLNSTDFIRKMKKVHDNYACATRPFILGETGLHFDADEGGGIEAKLKWLDLVTGEEARKGLKWMQGVSWFNYEKDRDYRVIWVGEGEEALNEPFVEWLQRRMSVAKKEASGGGKVKKFWKTLLAK